MGRGVIEKRLLRWQILVIGSVFIAYMLHYFCKVHLYVILNDFKEYIDPNSSSKADEYVGIMLSLGYVGYAVGKIILAIICDSYFKSALIPLLITLVGAPIFTFLFTINITNYTLRITISCILWFSIRFVIAAGWIGLVKLVANWVPPSHHGRVMAFCNLSWLFGDAMARSVLGWIYHYFDDDWRYVFYASAIVTAIAILPTVIFIRNTPISRGLPPIVDNQDNVYAIRKKRLAEERRKEREKKKYDTSKKKDEDSGSTMKPLSVLSMNEENNLLGKAISIKPSAWMTLKPLLYEPLFYMVLLMNFQYLFMRELYNIFFIAYLEDDQVPAVNDKAVASTISAIVPFVGSISVIFAGIWLDKIKSKHWRLSIIPIFSLVSMFCMGCFAILDPKSFSLQTIIFLVVLFGLSLYGPYSLMSGVLAVDIGGQTSAGMVSGFISAAGYSAGIIVSLISTTFEYEDMFLIATGCAGGIVIVGCVLFVYNKRIHDKEKAKHMVHQVYIMDESRSLV
eukprot:365242_1